MKDESIHPRARYGGEKSNTAKPRSKVRLERAKAGIQKHLEQHPRDGMSAQRVSTINATLAN